MIRLAFGVVGCFAVVIAAVMAAGTVYAFPYGFAVAVVGGLIVAVADRGTAR